MILLLLFPLIALDIYFILNKKVLFGQLISIPSIVLVLAGVIYWPFFTLKKVREQLGRYQAEWSTGIISYTFNNVEAMRMARGLGISVTLTMNPNPAEGVGKTEAMVKKTVNSVNGSRPSGDGGASAGGGE
ncbi:hypothetical protein HDU67_000726, partial [Dinochytrium kinnereticum]